MTVKDLKYLLDFVPDDAPVLLSKSDSCTIEEISYDTLEGIARLKITEGFEVMSSSFIDSLFNSLRKG